MSVRAQILSRLNVISGGKYLGLVQFPRGKKILLSVNLGFRLIDGEYDDFVMRIVPVDGMSYDLSKDREVFAVFGPIRKVVTPNFCFFVPLMDVEMEGSLVELVADFGVVEALFSSLVLIILYKMKVD